MDKMMKKILYSIIAGVAALCACQPETVLDRLTTYHKQTQPLEDYYRAKGLLVEIDGEQSVEKTTELVLKALGV